MRTLANAAAGFALLFASAAGADPQSKSWSNWTWRDGRVQMTYTLPQRDATALLANADTPRPSLHAALQNELVQSVLVWADDIPCGAGGTAQEPARPGYLRFRMGWQCPPGSARLTVTQRAMLRVAPSHIHFARFRIDGQPPAERLFSRRAPQHDVTLRGEPRQVSTSPGVWRAYVGFGLEHILIGVDHIAFLLGLLLLARRARDVIIMVTGFTLGHSATLALTVLGVITPEQTLVEGLIGYTIALVALENALENASEDASQNEPNNTLGNALGNVSGQSPNNDPENAPGNEPGSAPTHLLANVPANVPTDVLVDVPVDAPVNVLNDRAAHRRAGLFGLLLFAALALAGGLGLNLGLGLDGPPITTLLGLGLFTLCYLGLGGELAGRKQPLRLALPLLFGLVHGFGFAGVLTEAGLPEGRLVEALLAFNIGVELGQIVIVLTLALLAWLLRGIVAGVTARWASTKLSDAAIARWPGTKPSGATTHTTSNATSNTTSNTTATTAPLPIWIIIRASLNATLCGLGVFWFVERLY